MCIFVMAAKASKMVFIGGENRAGPMPVVGYDPDSKTSVNYPNFPSSLRYHCSLVLDDYIYCLGGDNENRESQRGTDNICRLNLRKQILGWEQVASMKTKRYLMGAAVHGHGDQIVVAGGCDETKCCSSPLKFIQFHPMNGEPYLH